MEAQSSSIQMPATEIEELSTARPADSRSFIELPQYKPCDYAFVLKIAGQRLTARSN